MTFIILAIDHNWQMAPYAPETPEMSAAKKKLEAVIASLIAMAKDGLGLICEECDPRYLSIAQKMAHSNKPRIPWKNIMMSAQERLEAGIYEGLLHRPSHCIENPPGSGCYRTVDHRIPEDDVREQFFSRECIQTAEANSARSVLILCGDMHVDALKEKLESYGHQVVTNRELIPKRSWQ